MPAPGPLEPTRTLTFPSSGGVTLYAEAYVPPRPPSAVAVMVHGYAEHCGRYREVANTLVGAGLAALGYDYRGHGRASGRRGHIDAWSEYHDDLDAAITQARTLAPGKRVLLVAHSNGSLITLRALTDSDRRPDVAGMVISSPFLALRLQVPPAKILLARGMSKVFPTFSQKNDLRVEDLTSDRDKQAARIADTLCHDVASARWFTEARDAQAHVLRQAANLTLPSLWVIGSDDPIADPTVSEPLARRLHGAEVHLLRGFKHEVWNERERAHPLALTGQFVAKIATA